MLIQPPKKVLLGLQEGQCNLACPKCYTHGQTLPSSNDRPGGVMDFSKFLTLVSELKEFSPRVTPQTWDEPFLTPDLFRYLKVLKENSLVVTMDTNGILLNRENRKMLIDLKIDSVFISVDAITEKTYGLVRGKDVLPLVRENTLSLLKERGEASFPRIGVSFVREENNAHEEEEFVDYWKELVDVVRVNQKFEKDRTIEEFSRNERTPCWSLYDSLMIHHDGSAALCCVDTHYQNEIGNVFDHGVSKVWNGDFFKKVRGLHEEGQYAEIQICADCELWSNDQPVSREGTDHLFVETQTHRYINRKDKLDSVPEGNRYVNA